MKTCSRYNDNVVKGGGGYGGDSKYNPLRRSKNKKT